MRSIFTAKGQEIVVDDEDYATLSANRWMISDSGYAYRRVWEGKRQVAIMMHRVILDIARQDPQVVDHINGNNVDNRRSNLRICTRMQNGCDRGAQRNNTTGYKGVTFRKESGKFMAQISSDGKRKYLGLYSTPQEAHAAYCVAALELHGEFSDFGDRNV
jgi:hypothetical protein